MSDFWQKNKKSILTYVGMFTIFIVLVLLARWGKDYFIKDQKAIDTNITEWLNNKFNMNITFEFDVQWYAVFILTGIIFGAILAFNEFKRFKVDTEILYDGLLYAVPLAILGARIWWVISGGNGDFSIFFQFQSGGLAIHGAVITVFIFLIFFTKKRKLNYWWLLDIVAPGFLIGQALGRWGNFLNGELYGPAVNKLNYLPEFLRSQMNINNSGVYHAPTFLFESLWNFIGLILILVFRHKIKIKTGDIIGFYLIWYGFIRIPMELLRFQGSPSDPMPLPWITGNATAWYEMTSIWISILMMLGGLSIMLYRRVIKKDTINYNEYIKDES